jgi:hypothetical protein
MCLSEFDLTIRPKPGKTNGNANAPSRHPVDRPDENWTPEDSYPHYRDIFNTATATALSDIIVCNETTASTLARANIITVAHDIETSAVDHELETHGSQLTDTLRTRIIREQRRDHGTRAIIEFLRHETTSLELPESARKFYTNTLVGHMHREPDGLITIETPYYVPGNPLRKARRLRAPTTAARTDDPVTTHIPGRRHNDVTQLITVRRAVVPTSMRMELLRLAHEAPLAGHLGRNRIYDTLTKQFFWKGMSTDVKAFIAACPTCQCFKNAPQPWL